MTELTCPSCNQNRTGRAYTFVVDNKGASITKIDHTMAYCNRCKRFLMVDKTTGAVIALRREGPADER